MTFSVSLTTQRELLYMAHQCISSNMLYWIKSYQLPIDWTYFQSDRAESKEVDEQWSNKGTEETRGDSGSLMEAVSYSGNLKLPRYFPCAQHHLIHGLISS